MTREGLRYQAFSRRAFILAGVQALALTALGGRLYYLTIVNGEKYRLRADKNRIALRLVSPVRGGIVDRNLTKLAINQPDFTIFLVPEQAGDVDKILRKLRGLTKISSRRLAMVRRQIGRQRKFLPVTVAQGLDWETFSRVNVAMPDLPGVITSAGLSRYYPDGREVAHIVGYLARPDRDDVSRNPLYRLPGFKVGRQGLERRFEDELRGSAGTRRVEVNSVGREIRDLPPRQDAVNGQDLKLTIDLELQRFATEQMGEEAAGVVVMDVKSGELLAMASTPTFDPNEFTRGISQENYTGLLNDPRKPLLNKSISGQYPPGSTFKMIVALAALEQGIITPETEVFCNGKHRLGKQTYHCWIHPQGHGKVDLLRGIFQSCDVYFYKMAEKMDIDHIAEMARRFGLEQTYNLGIDGERKGLIPDRSWKRAYRDEPWYLGETLNVSIGQGAVLATPLQLAVMTARLASGRAVEPSLVMNADGGKAEAFRQLNVNPLHLRTIRRGMEMVTEPVGVAHDYRRKKTAPKQAGKTGTAQVRRITKEQRESGLHKNDKKPWAEKDHALFVGYAPAENPRVAVSVLVQHGGGGSRVAAPIARRVMDKALELMDKSVEKHEGSTAAPPAGQDQT